MKIPKSCDVVVIGGGPAGSSAANLLAQKGVHVVLLEKQKFPRYTVGESLIPHFWKYTDELGVSNDIKEEGFIQKSGGASYWNGKLNAVFFSDHGHKRPGLHVERERFDEILLTGARKKGAYIFEEVEVKNATKKQSTTCVNYLDIKKNEEANISAKYVIDASGQKGLLANQFKLRQYDPNFKFQAFWGYFDKSDYLNQDSNVESFGNRFEKSPLSLVVETVDWGWVWQLVLRDRVSIGALLPKSGLANFKQTGDNLESRFQSYIKNTPVISQLLSESELTSPVRTIRDYAYTPTRFVDGQCYLVGDAAAFADPINSEGVTIALYAGFLAAWAVEKSLNNHSRSEFYKNVFSDTIKKRLHVFQVLSYPKKKIPKHLMQSCIEIVKNQSEEENNLILAHLAITNRAEDFSELTASMGVPESQVYRKLELPHSLQESIAG